VISQAELNRIRACCIESNDEIAVRAVEKIAQSLGLEATPAI